ncbi:class I SAM-dependent methyltransferase [Exilibacterium tricleocarpae]|uniref:Class I SAM-dependent methyltransferase n=1 Tax=Exilibacterium tricleocarpae TaxID=2591008 RepID=A0A545TLH2_9GAMM|nr:class I SAM-dependent methyltransferase [Exilibacterium tricleocarpae]TQV78072.1 class I SAM-dependent methyltransferase [Exilibacterium tricleocarpae]
MAILWQQTSGGNRYEVRSAGATRRLYTNGVFHSQYNPRHPVGGSVWDLLLLPAFFLPAGQIKRVLVLGVGGGAVMQQLNYFLTPALITGVELNPVHLRLAQRFFGLQAGNIELVQADAVTWVNEYRGPGYDLIIDDLFGHDGTETRRAVAVDADWTAALAKALAPRGALVFNFHSAAALRKSAPMLATERRFVSAYRLTTSLYDNVIGAFFTAPVTKKLFLDTLAATPHLDRRKKSCRLNFTFRKLR